MSPIIPSRYGHPKYNSFPQKSRATSLGGVKGVSQRGTPGSDSKSRRKQRLEENKITVQPTEDEEADNFYSKHLAAARFQRNHKLINVLFSDVVVEQDQITENDKLHVKQKRTKTLEDYRDRINKDIVELEERFIAKRRRIIEDGRRFNDSLRDYIEKSKREVISLKVAQDARRQKEILIRQQAPKPTPPPTPTHSTAMNLNSTTAETSSTPIKVATTVAQSPSSTTTQVNSNDEITNSMSQISSIKSVTDHNGISPMEIEPVSDLHEKSDIQLVLNGILSSVAKVV